jgi:hypothetical protein
MDKRLFWDSTKAPTVWAIDDAFKDVPAILSQLESLKANNDFPFSTVIIDPISIYADRVLTEMQWEASKRSKVVDTRQLYGDLATNLRVLLLRFHALPCHVLWLCHVKDGGLALAGSTADKLPAYMSHTFLCEATANGIATKYELHTQPYGPYTQLGSRWRIADDAGNRWGLPSPMVPSFKCVAQIYGLNGKPLSLSVPGFINGADYSSWPPKQ